MQTERGSSYIGKFSLDTFSIKQSKKLQDAQHRAILYSATNTKTTEVIFTYSFNFDALITHFEIQTSKIQLFQNCFQVSEPQADLMSNRGQFSQMLEIVVNEAKLVQNSSRIIVDAIGYTNSVRFKLVMKNQAMHIHMEELGLKKQRNKNIQQENIRKMVNLSISAIDIWGFVPNVSPMAHHLTKLLNISQAFKKFGRLEEAAQSQILVSLSLINARRFIQAAELLKKVSKYYVEKYISNKSGMEFSRMQRSWMRDIESKDDQDGAASLGRSFGAGRVLQGGKFLMKAAKVELILAETITHPSLIMEKLQAYSCANYYFMGNPHPNPLPPNSDLLQVTQSIGPQIINFLIKILYDKSEPLKIAVLKSIEFIFETLGCTMANFIVPLVKAMIMSYPSRQPSTKVMHSPIGINISSSEVSSMISTRNKLLVDHYHHLLETLLALFPQLSKKYLKILFAEIIAPNISNSQYYPELRLYLIRFSEKIMSICTADLQYNPQFFVSILNLCENKHNSQNMKISQNKHTNYNLTYFAQKNLDIIKSKVLGKLNNSLLIPICQWVNETLVYLCQNQMASITGNASTFYLNQALDFIIIIYSKKNLWLNAKINYPVQSILYFLNMSITHEALPFDKILQALIKIIVNITKQNPQAQIVNEMVERIMGKSKISNLNIKELKVLAKVLQIASQLDIQWLQMFLLCIPHSTFDQIYLNLDILLKKCQHDLHKPVLQKIITTLLDQYTVKGKAYQQSKQAFIEILLESHNSGSLLSFIQICLLQNCQPNVQKYHARRKKNSKQHTFDSKLFKIDYEMFLDKLGLVQLLLSKIQTLNSDHKTKVFASQQFICQLHRSVLKLITSVNGKLKGKGISIMKYLIYAFEQKQNSKINGIQLFFSKAIFSLTKIFMQNNRDIKLQYNAIVVIDQLFDRILKIDSSVHVKDEQSIDQMKLSFMDGNVECWSKQVEPLEYSISNSFYINLRLRQIIKLWPMLITLYNSPWECVRQIISVFLVKFFILDLSIYRISLQNKLLQLVKPLLKNLFHLNDHTQRLRAIKIYACLLGMGKKFKNKSEVSLIVRANSRFLKQFFPKIFQMQQDWDQNIAEICQCIVQLCITPENKQNLKKRLLHQKRSQGTFLESSFCTFNLGDQFNFQKKPSSFFANNIQDMEYFLKESSHFDTQEQVYFKFQQIKNQEQIPAQISNQIWEKIMSFSHYLQTSLNTKIEAQKDSFAQQQQQFFEAGQERAESIEAKQSKSQDQHLQFEDLGIIQLDDQQWGQQQNQVKITQKLPLKKIYKLSPSVGGSSKPQRIRSKRYNNTDMDHPQNIIVDQLQGKIQSKSKTFNERKRQHESLQFFYEKIKPSTLVKQTQQIKTPKTDQNYQDLLPQDNSQIEYEQLPIKSRKNVENQYVQTKRDAFDDFSQSEQRNQKQVIIDKQRGKQKTRQLKQRHKIQRDFKQFKEFDKRDKEQLSNPHLLGTKKKKTSRKRKPSMNKQKFKQV